VFEFKLNHFKDALDIHNEELSQNILDNYRLLEEILKEILDIKKEIV